MKVNSLNSSSNRNMIEEKVVEEKVDVDAIFNNWLGDQSAPQHPPEQPKIAWLESGSDGLTQQTKNELDRIRH